jgi:hypothetical protein
MSSLFEAYLGHGVPNWLSWLLGTGHFKMKKDSAQVFGASSSQQKAKINCDGSFFFFSELCV